MNNKLNNMECIKYSKLDNITIKVFHLSDVGGVSWYNSFEKLLENFEKTIERLLGSLTKAIDMGALWCWPSTPKWNI